MLVAEDDASVRDALSKLIEADVALELVGAATDAREAVELAAREQPDVAVIDVRMPGGGGVTAARGIRRRSPGTRVVALSAFEDRNTVLRMLEAGAVGYLVKGSGIDTILSAITEAQAGYGSLSSKVTGEVIEELAGQLTRRRRSADQKRQRERRIRRVLAEDGGLSVVFQPIWTLFGEIVGAEALSRFNSPDRGPERWFVEAAEVGLREELELASARKALLGLASFPPGVFLALNVSPPVVATESFLTLMSGVDAERVVVEVTENARIDDYESFIEALGRLRTLGMRIAVDDAGAGYSSLRHILRLAPDFIKLDRTLISGIECNRPMQALAAGLISFAEKIDATIVAEGIEREEEIDALLELGVRYGQGYYLGKPAPLPLRTARSGRRRAVL